MALINKAYFTIADVTDRWSMPRSDLAYLGENGLLRLSVRLFGVWAERGTLEEMEPGRWARVMSERLRFEGLAELREWDVHAVFRDGQAFVEGFHAGKHGYCELLTPDKPMLVREQDLMVAKPERDRFEREHGIGKENATLAARSDHFALRHIQVGDKLFFFGPIQAHVIKLLHDAALTAAPWRLGKTLLTEAGAASTKMVDVFKSQPDWRELIASDRRGHYRLKVTCELPDLVGDTGTVVRCEPLPGIASIEASRKRA